MPTYMLQQMNDWNDIIRDIFSDQLMKTLMMLPLNTNIILFIDRYFIKAGYTSKTLKNESVRIVYNDSVVNVLNMGVTKNALSFDIYVKFLNLHNAKNDRLIYRTNLIAQRLHYLLTKERQIHNYRFWIAGESDMGTSAIGYARYNITFNYLKYYG